MKSALTSATLLQIAQLGIPVLREKSKDVEKIKDRQVQRLIDDMIATVNEVSGVGIAAPQVYQGLRIFILASHATPAYPKAPKMQPKAIINPVILTKSENKQKDWEGCLSVPGIRGFVPRHTSLTVEYFTRTGKKEQKEFTDLLARIFQHEYDHLEGEVFLDRLESAKDIISNWVYQKMLAKKKT